MNTQLTTMSEQLKIEPEELQKIIMNTVMPAKVPVTNEQFLSFMAIANEYNLNPLSKEVYAFPAKDGGIQAVVSIDGWLKIINSHSQFDGMELHEIFDEKGNIYSVECKVYRKDRSHPTVIAEYLSECKRNTEPWKKEIRMLRHKATIQAARYAFGLSGITDADDAEMAVHGVDVGEKDITPAKNSKIDALLNKKPAPEPQAEPETFHVEQSQPEEYDESQYHADALKLRSFDTLEELVTEWATYSIAKKKRLNDVKDEMKMFYGG